MITNEVVEQQYCFRSYYDSDFVQERHVSHNFRELQSGLSSATKASWN